MTICAVRLINSVHIFRSSAAEINIAGIKPNQNTLDALHRGV